MTRCTVNPDLQSIKWKYLRETDNKYFDPRMNTSLKDYLEVIFPCNTFEYNISLKKDELPSDVEYKRYKCDALCRDLKLVVEFDGLNHYTDSHAVLNDVKRDLWFESIGYKTTRIPYWIQLSQNVVRDLFDVDLEDPLCEIAYSFYNAFTQKVDLDILPGNMCELGRQRFITEYYKFSTDVRVQIDKDLRKCLRELHSQELAEAAFPEYLREKMSINFNV